jgi:hypothetical protein
MYHIELKNMPDVELPSIISNCDNIAAVHADVEMPIVAVRHPVIRVACSPNSDLE